MKYQNVREEELKNKVAKDLFWLFDSSKIIGNVDFCVCLNQNENEPQSLLWAEAKTGSSNIHHSLVQLILTIGKARTFDKHLPPAMLGAFDGEKIAFIPYSDIHDVFYQNDFNWNVTPSNYETKEFNLVHNKVKTILESKTLLFNFINDPDELATFIKQNFIVDKFGLTKTKIDKNNFIFIYTKWLQTVKPTISVNWEIAKKAGIIDGDFYLADLLSHENTSLKDNLFVLLKHDHYLLDRVMDDAGMFNSKRSDFNDKQLAHTQFWNKYERPPRAEYWDYIVARRDLLVPQDVRERKGSFFTPQIWVELSQQYLTEVLGEDWQDEYYIWDCAAGTGNLLNGLTNKYHIFASTLDKQDVDVMHDRINNGANLLHDHVFQFDFLNDDFTKVPKALQEIINSPEKRKKLVVYINPPYAESNGKISLNRSNIQETKIHTKYAKQIDKVKSELYAQFLARIYFEIKGCFIAQFSKLKLLNGTNSTIFRNNFLAKLEKSFVMPADTFDNVTGQFPIGFFIWKTALKEKFIEAKTDVYNSKREMIGTKTIHSYDDVKRINDWLKRYQIKPFLDTIGVMMGDAPDFQNNNYVSFLNNKETRHGIYFNIDSINMNVAAIYLSVRHCIDATWLEDRDQFLYPNEAWENDIEFQNDCLAYALFHGQNRISSSEGTNHWIPFSEYEVNARLKFESNFMSHFIKGKMKPVANDTLFGSFEPPRTTPLVFSPTAQGVFDAALALWKYYHAQPNVNVNASLYDIREHFQGRNTAGKMNHKSDDETYMTLIGNLRDQLKQLAEKIKPKVYDYGFLKN